MVVPTSSEPLRALLPIKSMQNVLESTTAGLEIVQELSNGDVVGSVAFGEFVKCMSKYNGRLNREQEG